MYKPNGRTIDSASDKQAKMLALTGHLSTILFLNVTTFGYT